MPSVDEINRYAAFYKSLPHRARLQWQLILSDDAPLIAAMERVLALTQQQAVDDFLEDSCWSEDVPHLAGGKGSFEERRAALRAVYIKTLRDSAKGQLECSVLTPLEEDLYKLLYEVTAAYPEGQKFPPASLKHAKRLLERTREHASQLMARQLEELESASEEGRPEGDVPEIMWHSFVRSRDFVHLGLYPYATLCGMKFDGRGIAVHNSTDVFELARKQSPFAECEHSPVDCPDCVEIIRLCKIVEVKDLPPKHHLTEEEQDEMMRAIDKE